MNLGEYNTFCRQYLNNICDLNKTGIITIYIKVCTHVAMVMVGPEEN